MGILNFVFDNHRVKHASRITIDALDKHYHIQVLYFEHYVLCNKKTLGDGQHALSLAYKTEEAKATQQLSSGTAAGPEDLGRLFSWLTAAAAKASLLSLAPHEITPLDYGVLNRCIRGDASAVSELARAFPVDASMMSRKVSKLVDRGLISRRRLSSDRRTVRLSLTLAGRSLARQLAGDMSARQRLLMKGVSDDERAAFTTTAHKILANLEDKASTRPILGSERLVRPITFQTAEPSMKG